MEESFLSLDEVLLESQRLGLDLSERTFRYYSVMGLLPRPTKRPGGTGDARVHYYPADILHRLQEIRSLQTQGYSLKQIKTYFEVSPGALHEPSGPRRDEGDRDSDREIDLLARRLLESVAQGRIEEAGHKFLDRAHPEGGEANFATAALDYLADLTRCFFDSSEAVEAVRTAIGGASPLELERTLRPLRAWRDREWRRGQHEQVAVVTRLRGLASRCLAGLPPEASQEGRLAGYVQALAQVSARAREGPNEGSEWVERAGRWLADALERLAVAGQRLLQAVTAQELQEVGLALRDLEEAEGMVIDLRRVLSAYRTLVTLSPPPLPSGEGSLLETEPTSAG